MKKILFFATLLFSGGMTFAQSLTSGIDPENLDTSIRPGDDFYHYAAGGWLRNNPLDEEHTDNGAFTDLYEKSQKDIHIRALLKESEIIRTMVLTGGFPLILR